ncbi:MAG: polymerase I, DNA polymerase I protein, partial [Candidatus Levybacteria bacterium GW2011_GWC1_40_19]
MSKLVLIDGNAIVHRAFHALPPLNNKNGQVTNAVYGFFAMVLKVVNDLRPEHLIVCFDKAAPTFRKVLYVGYQSQRPKMVDELSSQFVALHEVLEKAGIKIFEVDGYEADDLIGTISKQSREDVIILSGDRDLLQLVNGRVRVLAPIVGVTKMILFDEEKVEEKYGLKTHQLADYKALVGDASDNYPGVTGIGPKTASTLIREYDTLENLYKHLVDLSPKISEKLATDAEQAVLAKKLATIEVAAPIKYVANEAKVSSIDE